MKARTLIFTGDGKGKTTAALGMVLRAAGHGQRVLVVQFIKSNPATGEMLACTNFGGVELVQMGCGFVPSETHPSFDMYREMAEQALKFASDSVVSGRFDLIVLDEICNAVAKELIDENAVVDLLNLPGRTACIVLTGRNAGARLMEQADTVTEMRCIKHGYAQGIDAQKGVEF